jgi:hypothetical protein
VKAHDVVLVMAVGLEPGEAVFGSDFHEPPVFGVELPLGIEVLDAIADIADFGHTAHCAASSFLSF